MSDLVTLGESMVLLVPTRSGLLRYADRFERYVAGAESNTAIGLARLGHDVGWISRLGADEFGACIRSTVRGEGVDVSRVIEDGGASTAVFFKERRRPDATRVYYYRSASAASRLSADDLDPAYIQQAQFLHLTGITPALGSSCRAAVWKAIELARDARTIVSFDPNIRFKLWSADEARRVLGEIIPEVDIVLASADEAELLTGTADPETAARRLTEMGPEEAIIKRGSQGALAVSRGTSETVRRPAVDVPVVEEIGAGDAFNAGYLSGRLRGWNTERSLHLGAVMGALAVTVPGDVEGLPTWDEVQPYLAADGEADAPRKR